mgnify:CR=1 FL=1
MATSTINDGCFTRIKKATSTEELAKIVEEASQFTEASPRHMEKVLRLVALHSNGMKKSSPKNEKSSLSKKERKAAVKAKRSQRK